ncbi:sugar-binding transcriptional regulator [Rubrimonas cliftonensis]|uniref:DNA-binding transcriptional regulator LsrR, DeoR family n=1 Tax=Rubrimonas cliftonensis TaxID=89524 RepID=A0A1H4C3C7_9RHOB|nr:sugar-binding transcriptional regulator [Rubrimonas cliftonensis]SEA54854.1 DNA-binding transcriptional regulator LsrR, DeoR family [Rubrimonas cliftonensis]
MTADGVTRLEAIDEDEMSARAAWLHHVGGMTQSAIAKRFGIPVTRAHRMIARAARDGLVRVFVDAEVAGCIALEHRLTELFALRSCVVAPELGEGGAIPLKALGVAGANLLMGLIEGGEHRVIGVGHGSTMAAAVAMMPRREARDARFVSLLGGLTRRFAANPYDVIFRLAERTGAEAFLMPAPLFANSAADRDILLAQPGVGEVSRMWAEASVCLVGVGAVDMAGSIARADVFDPENSLRDLRAQGARAEILGQFLDAEGRLMSTPYDGRVIAADLFSLKGREAHAIAGGETKAPALSAALKSGVFTGLITDEATARRLIAIAEGAAPAEEDCDQKP